MITLSEEELARDPDAALAASKSGPVFLIEGKQIAYVLLSIDAYNRLAGETDPDEPRVNSEEGQDPKLSRP
ncbi:hypothetical protein [Rhodoplanes sp. SY1]|uniref:hypothetical protein n=1 Tax=Rhodoplanes sp. SY1 TaxID=3166646 RepID=UPI0038B68AE3